MRTDAVLFVGCSMLSDLRQRALNTHGNSSSVLNQVAIAVPISSGESSCRECLPLTVISTCAGQVRLQEDALSKRRCPAFLLGRAPALFPFQHKHRMADRRTLKILK